MGISGLPAVRTGCLPAVVDVTLRGTARLRIPDPVPNMLPRPYGCLSVQEVDVALTETSLTALLVGREVYWQTEYLALRRGDVVALAAVRKASTNALSTPVLNVRVLHAADVRALDERRLVRRGGDPLGDHVGHR